MKLLQTKTGFSLLETLVAVAITSLAITGTLSVISNNVSAAANAKDRVTAFYLAQDALEYVRNLRDTGAIVRGKGRGNVCGNPNPPPFCDGVLGGDDWLGPLRTCEGATCLVDTAEELGDDAIDQCGNETITEAGEDPICDDPGDAILLDEDTGTYHHGSLGSTDDPTVFFREVSVEEVVEDQEAIITVRMRWAPHGVLHTFTVSEHIFNWQRELGPGQGGSNGSNGGNDGGPF